MELKKYSLSILFDLSLTLHKYTLYILFVSLSHRLLLNTKHVFGCLIKRKV